MSELKVTRIEAGNSREEAVETGTKAWQLFVESPSVIAARVGDDLKDLAYEVADGDVVEAVDLSSPDGRNILRHSTA
ncbi:MAG: threonine--tRNA ligase, partial [Aeromicrobium sp.]